MATARVELELTSKGLHQLKATASGLDGVGEAAKRADAALNNWTNAQQRAALKMEKLHEEALKANAGFSSTDDKAQLFSATLGKMSTTATASAAALGLPVGQLGALNAATEVAALGFGQLTKSAVAFNAASLGVVGAGLAIGAAIGTMLRQIGESENILGLNTKEADRQIAELAGKLGFFKVASEAAANGLEKISAGQQIALEAMRRRGLSMEEIINRLSGKAKANETLIDRLKKEEDAHKKSAEATKKAKDALEEWELQHAKNVTQAQKEWLEREAKEAAEAAEAVRKYEQALADVVHAIDMLGKKATGDYWKQQEQKASDAAKRMLEGIQGRQKAEGKAAEKEKQHLQDLMQLYGEISNTLQMLGASGSNFFVQIADGMEKGTAASLEYQQALTGIQKAMAVMHAAQAAFQSGSFFGGAATGAAFGAQFGVVGGIVGGLAGGLLGLFGHAKKVREEMRKMREELIGSEGGLKALEVAAQHSGISLQAMFDAKNAKQLAAAIDQIKSKLDITTEAEKKLREAMERYGITVDEMGPKFAQQELDKQALQLWQDYQLLTIAGGDHNAMLSKMAPAMNDYIQTALKAGSTIPDNLRPIIEQMISLGLLTDESGAAFGSLEEAGINFGKSLEDSMKAVVDQIKLLIAELGRLYGLPPIEIPVTSIPGMPPGGPPPGMPEFATGGYVSKTGLAYLHAGEFVMPPHLPIDLGGGGGWAPSGGGGGAPVLFEPPGGGGGWSGGPGGGGGGHPMAQIEETIKRAIAKAQPAPQVNVSPTVAVDANFTPPAARQQLIQAVGDEVARGFRAGGRNRRDLVAAVRSALVERG
jgi:hypothetical protein